MAVVPSGPVYTRDSIVPPEVLVPLLFTLRNAYASPALQRKLRAARKADVSQYSGTWRWGAEELDVCTIVREGSGLRIRGRFADCGRWHGMLELHGDTLQATVQMQDAGPLALLQVRFIKSSLPENRGQLQLTFSGFRGEWSAEFIASQPRGRSVFNTPPFWEAQEILAQVQRPIFDSFGLPGPPAGVWVLMNSVGMSSLHSEVVSIGNQCRRLLGQMGGDCDPDDTIAAAAYTDAAELAAQSGPWSPAAPAPERGVKVAHLGLHGEGLVALRDFDVGQEIVREEPLAVLRCGSSVHQDLRSASRKLLLSGQADAALRSSLWRGPREGPKARQLAEVVDMVTDGGPSSRRDVLLEALLIFGFNAFSTEDDSGQVLYTLICKANHSCAPNAAVVVSASSPGQLVCVRPVAEGEEVTVSYLTAKEATMDRRERLLRLRRGWEFTCGCCACNAAGP